MRDEFTKGLGNAIDSLLVVIDHHDLSHVTAWSWIVVDQKSMIVGIREYESLRRIEIRLHRWRARLTYLYSGSLEHRNAGLTHNIFRRYQQHRVERWLAPLPRAGTEQQLPQKVRKDAVKRMLSGSDFLFRRRW